MIKIKQGSVFDTKCDLLILPCDSEGGVTQWVENEIEQNKLPFTYKRIPYGKCFFVSVDAVYPKADVIGYAASVNAKNIWSEISAIRSILRDIVDFCIGNNSTSVNIPLLGTGAGKLDPSEVFSTYKEFFENNLINLNVYILDKEIARNFLSWNAEEDNYHKKHPRVFISYSWKDELVKAWVLELAKSLCANGVDARLDRFHLKPGMDMPQWMTNEVIKADKVLLICDEHYAEKADTRKAGVGWETMIIQGDMLTQGEMNTKYIVVAYGSFEKNTPIYMKSKLSLSKENIDTEIKPLLEQIFDIDSTPKIGKIPQWVYDMKK